MSGDQFAPYDPPFMKRWREGLESKPVKPVKPAKVKRKKKAKK